MNRKASILLLVLLLVPLFSGLVSIPPALATSSGPVLITTIPSNLGLPFQNKIWYNTPSGWTYVFWTWYNVTWPYGNSGIHYVGSNDNFATNITGVLTVVDNAPTSMIYFDVWMNDTYGVVEWRDHVTLKMERELIKINTDHTLSVVAGGGQTYEGAGDDISEACALSSTGYEWVSRVSELAYPNIPFIGSGDNSKKNGTWGGYLDGQNFDNTHYGYIRQIPLANNDMYFLWTVDCTSAVLKGCKFTASTHTFGATETVSGANLVVGGNCFDAVYVGGVIYVTYVKVGGYVYEVHSVVGTGTWSTPFLVSSTPTIAGSQVIRHNTRNLLWFVWITSDYKIWARPMYGGVWYAPQIQKVYSSISEINMPYEISDATWQNVGFLFHGTGVYYDTMEMGTLSLEDVTILDMEGCGNWVFADEKYYSFNATYNELDGYTLLDTVELQFSDGVHNITVAYDRSTAVFSIVSGSEYIYLSGGTVVGSGVYLGVMFKIYFRNTITDALDVDISLWANNTLGDTKGWTVIKPNYFNIYNHGGFVSTISSGDAGRSVGGDVFELYAGNNSWVSVNQTWRKLQQAHNQFSLQMYSTDLNTVEQSLWQDNPHQGVGEYSVAPGDWYLNTSIWYCDSDGVWVKGWTLSLTLKEGDWNPLTAQWTTINATWYQKNTKIKSDLFTAWIEANPSAVVKFWLDLWFNQADASSVGGGRVNGFYFGMSNTGPLPGLWNNWDPKLGNSTDSFYFMPLLDNSGDVIHATELKLMKVQYTLSHPKTTYSGFKIILRDFAVADFPTTGGRMQGIPTPIVMEPKVPDMAATGFLAPVINAIRAFGSYVINNLITAMMGMFGLLTGLLDYVFGLFGLHNGFSTFLAYLTTTWDYVLTSLTLFTAFTATMFQLITGPFVSILTTTVDTLLGFLNFVVIIVKLITGGYTWVVDSWTILSGPNILLLCTSVLLPIWIFKGADNGGGVFGIWNRLQTVLDVIMYFLNFAMMIVRLFVDLVFSLIDAIPVVE